MDENYNPHSPPAAALSPAGNPGNVQASPADLPVDLTTSRVLSFGNNNNNTKGTNGVRPNINANAARIAASAAMREEAPEAQQAPPPEPAQGEDPGNGEMKGGSRKRRARKSKSKKAKKSRKAKSKKSKKNVRRN